MSHIDASRCLARRDDCFLVVIDAQERLLPAISGSDEILANMVRLVKFSLISNIPVIVTEQEKLGPTVREIREVLPDFSPVGKDCFDCLSSHEFRDRVLTAGRRTLVLTGVEAHICVAQTALRGSSGFSVHVVSDAISSRALQNKEVALQRMARAGSVITSTEMFIYEILGRAGTDEFKRTLPLVK